MMRIIRNIITGATWARRSTYTYMDAMDAMDAVLTARLTTTAVRPAWLYAN